MIRLSSLAYLLRLGPRRLLGLVQHLPSFLRLFWRLFKDRRVGFKAKLLALGVVGYLIMPADLVPDLLPALGHFDDILLLFLGSKGFIALCPREVVQEHVQRIGQGR
ncbi:MAG: DUF1232 domain-containing protein [Deltaproteobacteria bacterium]|nr:DUF1232 domain-containing protein [Deltaproteobacteria bacterium]